MKQAAISSIDGPHWMGQDRGHGEDAIYFDEAKNRYVGATSLGFGSDGKRIRRKVSGRAKQEVRDKLKGAHAELDRGLHTATYTVRQAVDDWLEGSMSILPARTRSSVERLVATGKLETYHLLPGVRGDLLLQFGRVEGPRRVPARGDDDVQRVRVGSRLAPGRRYLTG